MKIYFLLVLGLLFAVAYSLPVEEDEDENAVTEEDEALDTVEEDPWYWKWRRPYPRRRYRPKKIYYGDEVEEDPSAWYGWRWRKYGRRRRYGYGKKYYYGDETEEDPGWRPKWYPWKKWRPWRKWYY